MATDSLIYRFYTELKSNEPREQHVKYLAKLVPLEATYNNVDLLTFTIFYQSKSAFHILINRGISVNPKVYKDIPPLLWSLEISTDYFFRQLIKRTKVNLFHIEPQFGENLLSNICLKLDDINLFNWILKKMDEKDPIALRSLMATKVIIDNDAKYPLEICLYNLNSKLVTNPDKKLQKSIFQKVKTLLSYLDNTNFVQPIQFFFLLPKYDYIMEMGNEFLVLMFQFLQQKNNLEDFFRTNLQMVNFMIENHTNMVAALVFKYLKMRPEEKIHFINIALEFSNMEMFKIFLQQGCNFEMVKRKDLLIQMSIEYDNIELYQELTRTDKLKYYIWELSQNIKIPLTFKYFNNYSVTKVSFPANYRALHLACFYQSHKIIDYLLQQVGDSLDYAGVCQMTPRALLLSLINKSIISSTFYNELTVPKILTPEFESHNKLGAQECAICLDDFHNHQVTILECGHIFHTHCLMKNKKNSMDCPYCRAPVIHKYQTYYKMAYLLPKVKEQKKNICQECPPCVKPRTKKPICLPVPSITYEDKDDFYHLSGQLIKKVKETVTQQLKNEFQRKIEIPERTIKIKELRKLLIQKKIGQRPKRLAKTKVTEDGEWNPPNTPDYRKTKTGAEIAKRLSRQSIDSNNIILGVRTSRGRKPKMLINEC